MFFDGLRILGGLGCGGGGGGDAWGDGGEGVVVEMMR